MTPIHNNKQNKVPLREEGVDPAKVKPEDKVLWIDAKGRGHTYVDFHVDHWEDLKLGRAQLWKYRLVRRLYTYAIELEFVKNITQ